MATEHDTPTSRERGDLDSDSGNSSDSDNENDSEPLALPQVEWLATSRAKRSTAGNRMKSMLANEEPAAEDDDLELLFVEDDDDAGFVDAQQDDSDVQMDSSSDDEDQDAAGDELEGEKELERQAKVKRKRKAQEAIPAKFRKKVRIEQPETRSITPSSTATATTPTTTAPRPRPKKKSERLSWLPSVSDLPTRSSDRKTTRLSKEQLHRKMEEDEVKRRKLAEAMAKKQARLDALKKPPMTQAERLAEAALVEKRNAKSLNRWEEAEKQREEERLRKIAALRNRKLDGPVVTFYSGIQTLEAGLMKHVGKMVSIEEKTPRQPRKKRQSLAEAEGESGSKPEDATPKLETTGDVSTLGPAPHAPSVPIETNNATQTVGPDTPTLQAPSAAPVPLDTASSVAPQETALKVEAPLETPVSAAETQNAAGLPQSQDNTSKTIETPMQTKEGQGTKPASVSAPLPFNVAQPQPPQQPLAQAVVEEPPTQQLPITQSSASELARAQPQPDAVRPSTLAAVPLAPPTTPSLPVTNITTPDVSNAPVTATPSAVEDPGTSSYIPRSDAGVSVSTPNLDSVNHTNSANPPPSGPPVPSYSPSVPMAPPASMPMAPMAMTAPPYSMATLAPIPMAGLHLSATGPPVRVKRKYTKRVTVAPPEPELEPEPEPPMEGNVTRSCIILQNFDEEAIKDKQVQTQILFGQRMSKLAKPAQPPVCVISNHPALYQDPQTGLPFANSYAYKEIRRLHRGEYKYSSLIGGWVGPTTYAARGVPERFLDPTKKRTVVKEPEPVPNSKQDQVQAAATGQEPGAKVAAKAEGKSEDSLANAGAESNANGPLPAPGADGKASAKSVPPPPPVPAAAPIASVASLSSSATGPTPGLDSSVQTGV